MVLGYLLGVPGLGPQRAGGAAVFTPADLPGVYLWTGADQVTGLSHGDPVTTLPNAIPGGPAIVRAAGGNQVWHANVKNGLPGIWFPGAGDGFDVATWDLSAETALTVYALLSCDSTGSDFSFYEHGATGSAGSMFLTRDFNFAPFMTCRGSAGSAHVNWVPLDGGTSNFRLLVGRGDRLLPRQEAWLHIDGHQQGGMQATTSQNSGFLQNAAGTIGYRAGGTRDLKGYLLELIVCSERHARHEHKQVGDYLAAKWGLTNWALTPYNLVFEGDSHTEGGNSYFTNSWMMQVLSRLTGKHVWSSTCVSGQTVQNMIDDRDTDVAPLIDSTGTNVITFWGGTNDLHNVGGNQTKETTLARMLDHAGWLMQRGTVIAATMVPRSDAGTPGDYATSMNFINTYMRAHPEEFGDYLWDIAALPFTADSTDATYRDVDHVHFNAWGHTLLAADWEANFAGLIGEPAWRIQPRDVAGLKLWSAPDRDWGATLETPYTGSVLPPYSNVAGAPASVTTLTASLTARRPNLRFDEVVGRAVWVSNGSTLIKSTAAIDLSATGAVTVVMAVKTIAGDDGMLLEFGTDYTAGTDGFAIRHETGNTILAGLKGDVGLCEQRSSTQTGWVVISAVFDKSKTGAAEVELYLNGDATGVTSVTSNDNGNATTFGNLTLHLLGRNDASPTVPCASGTDLEAVLLWDRAIAISDRQKVEQDLCERVGLTWTGVPYVANLTLDAANLTLDGVVLTLAA